MEDRSELQGALVRVLQILHDYADDLVLVGGWVPYLHLTWAALRSAPRALPSRRMRISSFRAASVEATAARSSRS